MNEQPIAERIRELANDLIGTVDRAKRAVLFPAADTTPGAEYRAAFAGLYAETDLRATIAREIALDAESAAPARPLQAVLADIVAEGYHVQLSVHADGHAYLSTWAGEKATDEAGGWRHGNGADPAQLAEARLADIRKLREEQAANPLVGLDLTPDQVRQNIERALARQDPAAAVEAVLRDADADAEAMLEGGCPTCDGCGQVADTENLEPWTAWSNLPPGSDAAVRMGLVKPIPCPDCGGEEDPTEADGEPATELVARELRQREDAASESGEEDA